MEILDLYNANGEKLNKTIARGQKPVEGEYIKLAVVYVKCGDKYLLQKCSKEKGGEYAITGGHVPSGFTSLQQACVETEEELGLHLSTNDLKYLGSMPRGSAIFDVFLYENDNLKDFNFVLQEEEVEGVYWYTKAQIEKMIEQGVVRKSSCLHYEKFIK